ncbi:uncharacterized protein SOCE26_078700 [Sorangium cellulosum]|uniref:Protein kinase domain-containing protein n=1 Tax=Sorangium cellulosum TaxID=56 RepID=A0A2L0F463_SORCE|nr:serine/threonine-protein kinase [Sorangium cellulosum]AUX46364.1 uncharacterized protein SOCE26_078700 [Sorangium cellulosum]
MQLGSSLADRFVIERLAGRGGMGEVYRGLDRSTGQPVAIKVLHGSWDAGAARFAREVMVLARLDHPLVVRHVAEGVLPSGEPYLVMEWLDGEDLASRLARGWLGAQDGVALALSVAEALAALHAGGIVHRDLKPSNIFLVEGRADRIKILDFGLVQVEAMTPITASGTLLGTVAYMAPEQARGARQMDARADVFALGCVLFECLTGEPPFAAASAEAALTKILFEETPHLRDRMPGAPPALDALLARMLAKDPADRLRDGRSAAALLRALGAVHVRDVEPGGAGARTPDLGLVDTEETPSALALATTSQAACAPELPALTDSEQRAVTVIQSACGIRGGEPLPTRQERLAARVAERIGARDHARVTEFLGEIIDAPFPDDRSAPLRTARRDAQVMSEQVRAAFLDFIAAECAARPLLVLIEDLHWGDGATARLLDVALRELRERPLFVLALARPEIHDVFPELWATRRLQEIRLRELPRKAAERLAAHVLGGRAGAATIERVVRLSEGNTFYLEELIRATAEGRGEDLPETVVAMVQSRLGALADEDRRTLRAASVFGETFCKGETIRRRRSKPEWFRNVGCCARQLRGRRGEAGGAVRGHGRARAGAGGAGRQGRGFGSLRPGTRSGQWSFTIQRLGEEELGAAAVERRAPEPIGAVPRRGAGVGPPDGRSAPRRRRGPRARTRGRRRLPRHARVVADVGHLR